MPVTIQQIADRAGVSRGTVDRVLNERGRVSPDVETRIRSLASEMGYVKRARKKASPRQTKLKLGIVTQLSKSSFMIPVNRGIQQAKEDLADRGIEVLLKEGLSVDEAEQEEAIDALIAEGIHGLAIMPVESEEIRIKLNQLIENRKVPVVTFNSDIVGTRRSCFVGMDNRKSGRTAAGLMGMLTAGTGKVLAITGYFSSHVDNARIDGFVDELNRAYPNLELAGVQGSFDKADEVERIIKNALLDIPGINGILVVSGGQAGVGRAFQALKLDRRPHVVIYDQTPDNEKALKEDTVDFLIDQNGYVQGLQPPHILANMLLKKQPPDQEYLYTEINIKTKYNL